MKMICWAVYIEGHGLVLHSICFTPEGQTPDAMQDYERISSLDYERDDPPIRMKLKHKSGKERREEMMKFKPAKVIAEE